MYDKAMLCEKIRALYPDIGECGIDVNVGWSEVEKRYIVHLKKNNHELKTFLEDGDADSCMLGKQCVSLGIEIAQLRDNIQQL